MEDQQGNQKLSITVELAIGPNGGEWRYALREDLGRLIRAKLLLAAGVSDKGKTPTDLVDIDVRSQGTGFALEDTFMWLDALQMNVLIYNEIAQYVGSPFLPEGSLIMVSDYLTALFHQIVDSVHQLSEAWRIVSVEALAVQEPIVQEHYARCHDAFVMFSRTRDTFQHRAERYPGQKHGSFLVHQLTPTEATWGPHMVAEGTYEMRDKKGTFRVHLKGPLLSSFRSHHVDMCVALRDSCNAFGEDQRRRHAGESKGSQPSEISQPGR